MGALCVRIVQGKHLNTLIYCGSPESADVVLARLAGEVAAAEAAVLGLREGAGGRRAFGQEV